MQSKISNQEKKYLDLFEFVDETNEVSLIFEQTSPSVKNHLYRSILKSLRNFHEVRSPALQIRNMISESEILIQKGLFFHAEKNFTKALKLAETFNFTDLKKEILVLKLSLIIAFKTKTLENNLFALLKEISKINVTSTFETQLHQTFSKWIFTQRRSSNDLENWKTLREEWNKRLETLPSIDSLSFKSQNFFYNIQSLEADTFKSSGEKLKFAEKILNLWKESPQMIELKPRSYLIYANNYLTTCSSLNQWHKFPPLLEELKQLPIRNFNQAGEAFQVIAFKELFYLLNTQKFEQAEKTVCYIEEGLEKYKAKVHDARRLTFYYNISILYFMMKNYDKALDWILKIVNYDQTEHRLDLQRVAPFFELIYHYELGNLLLVNSKITTLRIRMRRKGKLSDFEKSVLSHLKKLCSKVDKDELSKIRNSFLVEMEELFKTQPGLGVEECVIWLKGKK